LTNVSIYFIVFSMPEILSSIYYTHPREVQGRLEK
jgi:hypothetical protein